MVFDASFNNNCSSSVSSAVGVLGVVYCVVGNFNVALVVKWVSEISKMSACWFRM